MQCIEQIGNADNYPVLWGNSELNTCYCISQLFNQEGGDRDSAKILVKFLANTLSDKLLEILNFFQYREVFKSHLKYCKWNGEQH